MTTLQGSWIWYELMTTDPVGAKAFYDAVVGWDIDAASVSPDMDYRMIKCADGGMTGGVFKLNDEMLGHGAKPSWLGYVGVDDCDAAAKAVEAAGGTVLMPPHDITMAGRIAMVADCCGAPFYIMTPLASAEGGESTAFSTSLHGRCSWNELLAASQAGAIGFYTGLFGWDLPEPMDMGPMGQYQFINHDGGGIGAIMQAPEGAPAGWYHYFRVASIDAACTTITAHGGRIMNGPMEVSGDDWIVQGIDPQGAMFSLVGAK